MFDQKYIRYIDDEIVYEILYMITQREFHPNERILINNSKLTTDRTKCPFYAYGLIGEHVFNENYYFKHIAYQPDKFWKYVLRKFPIQGQVAQLKLMNLNLERPF